MAKRKSSSNKSQMIRDYLKGNPKATAGEIVPALAEQGVKVSPGLVHKVKTTLRLKRALKRTAKKAATRRASNGVTAEDLFQAKELVDQLGGIEQARRAVETLEKLR